MIVTTLSLDVFLFKKKFIYLADSVLVAAHGFSLVAESGACSLLAARRLLIAVAPRSQPSARSRVPRLHWLLRVGLLVVVPGLSSIGLSSCGARTWLLRGLWYLPQPGKSLCPAFKSGS